MLKASYTSSSKGLGSVRPHRRLATALQLHCNCTATAQYTSMCASIQKLCIQNRYTYTPPPPPHTHTQPAPPHAWNFLHQVVWSVHTHTYTHTHKSCGATCVGTSCIMWSGPYTHTHTKKPVAPHVWALPASGDHLCGGGKG
jgi:hypothetical protein